MWGSFPAQFWPTNTKFLSKLKNLIKCGVLKFAFMFIKIKSSHFSSEIKICQTIKLYSKKRKFTISEVLMMANVDISCWHGNIQYIYFDAQLNGGA